MDGFKNIFQRETKEGKPLILHISPSNLYMLSHNVPAYKFTGGEINGVVRGMFELDNLALSHKKLQDIDNQIKPKEGNFQNSDYTDPVL